MLLDRNNFPRPNSKSKDAILLLAGKKVAEGTVADITAMFQRESARSGCTVEMRILENGAYKTKRLSSRVN